MFIDVSLFVILPGAIGVLPLLIRREEQAIFGVPPAAMYIVELEVIKPEVAPAAVPLAIVSPRLSVVSSQANI